MSHYVGQPHPPSPQKIPTPEKYAHNMLAFKTSLKAFLSIFINLLFRNVSFDLIFIKTHLHK
jgi:hypothetical protein